MRRVSEKIFTRVPLRRKLVFFFLIAAILPLLVADYLSYEAISRQAEQSATREIVTIAESESKSVTEFMDSRCGEILIWSKLRFIKEALELAEIKEEVSENLREMAEVSGVYQALFLVDAATGIAAASSRSESGVIDFAQKEIFAAAKSGKFAISALERDKMAEGSEKSGGWTLSIAAPVEVNKKITGVFIAYLRWQSLENLLIRAKVAQTGYVFIVDKNNRIILGPKKDLYGTPLTGQGNNLTQLSEAIKDHKSFVVYNSNATGKPESRTAGIAYPKPERNLPDLEWKIVADAPSSEVLLLPNILTTLIWIALGAVLFVFTLSLVLSDRIAKPIASIAEVARRVADRDLTVEAPEFSRTDEIGDLSRAFTSMLESVKSQIGQMLQTTNVLKGAVEQITSTVSEVASGAAQVAGSVSETSTTLEELRQSARISGEKAKDLSEMAKSALGASIEGRKATDATVQGMRAIGGEVKSVADTVAKLSQQSKSVEQIIATVKDLADQSNLLAVNASIEAARAGEMGMGFTVVAHEIKSLADQSRRATLQIVNILQDTRKWIGAAVASVKQVDSAVKEGIDQSGATEEAIAILNESVEMSSREAVFIETSSSQQSVTMDQVSTAMMSIEEAINRNLRGVDQLEDAAATLADLGDQVSKLVEAYRT